MNPNSQSLNFKNHASVVSGVLLVHLGGALYLAGATQFAEAIADYVVLELDF